MLTIDIDSKPVSDLLTQLVQRMGNLQPVMRSIGMAMETRISARFETRTDPSGKAWSQWAQSTLDNYPKDGRRKILERYGQMLHSLNSRADQSSVRIGFGAVASKRGDVYAIYHEFGTEHMPRRGLLFADPESGTLSDGDEAAVLDIIGVYLSAR